MELLTPSIGLIFWTTLIFVILFLLLAKFAWKPILSAVNEREAHIEDALNQAKKAREEMAYLKNENEKILQQAREERDAMLKEAREMRNETINKAKEDAKLEAEKIIVSARESIQTEKAAAIADIKNQVATLSIGVAEKVLGKQLSQSENQNAYVDELIKDINLS
ncbi:F0F1 ATP synthase subunit B [Weeksellaceae bacterium KMM 9713]|uniref:ATP synthase subunit b n=1 Tax=Profundicola chukchiensis TaxID=2961959 RepID=A0A9X4MWD5_9FLAO|nr:F0F1 ATP synthase subunit B [Profundicola chukchiensis]MDG4945214.1 F0F1 ATP synthase subunit B [Profundicola chukchiensis]MDG4950288.1 F0F1 ATP synthase subunit B [Profundicola chukchiensis]